VSLPHTEDQAKQLYLQRVSKLASAVASPSCYTSQGAFALPALASQLGGRNFQARGFLNKSLSFRFSERGTTVRAARVSDWHVGDTDRDRKSPDNSPVQK